MTTLATSRLLLPPPPQLLPILSGVSAESLAHKMHPDKLLMHAHGVTSPRLVSTGEIVKSIQHQSASVDNLMEFTRTPATIIDDDDMVMTGDLNDEVASVCDSEDSDLSVGQENCDRSNKLVESVEAVSRPTSSDDGSPSVDASIPKVEDLVDPFAMAALRIPAVPVVRPSPTRFQEEFLRKSHIYAEELMKQQMQFMAAARASAFSLRHTTEQAAAAAAAEGIHNFTGIHSHLSAISKMTQMTQMTQMSQMSQITQNGGGESALSKLTAFGLVAQSANSPASSLNQLQQQMHAQLPFINNNIHEPSLKFSIDNILKADFGRRITDPLIKLGSTGGVGGCNTRGRSGKRSDKNSSNSAKKVISSVATTSTSGTPIDLTNVCSSATAPTTTTTVVPNTHCTNSNDSTSTVFSSNYSTPVKSPTSASSSATTTAASPSEATGVENLTEACGSGSGNTSTSSGSGSGSGSGPIVWPAWVYCTRYSDRPSSGPRTRKPKKPPSEKGNVSSNEDKRPRTAFSGSQLARLKHEFTENRYLTEKRRQQLSAELGLNEAQIKIWFQNKRAKIKKSSGTKNPLALQLMAQGLYNHSTIPLTKEEEELQELQAKAATIA